jgi:hypothetical protein
VLSDVRSAVFERIPKGETREFRVRVRLIAASGYLIVRYAVPAGEREARAVRTVPFGQ